MFKVIEWVVGVGGLLYFIGYFVLLNVAKINDFSGGLYVPIGVSTGWYIVCYFCLLLLLGFCQWFFFDKTNDYEVIN